MQDDPLDVAVEQLEKANADLKPELLSVSQARARLEVYARARRLVDFAIANVSPGSTMPPVSRA